MWLVLFVLARMYDKRDWASIGKCSRVCASRDKENGWKWGKLEVTTPLGHLRSPIRMFYCGIHIADMII